MKTSEIYLLLGAIYAAPHINNYVSMGFACVFAVVSIYLLGKGK